MSRLVLSAQAAAVATLSLAYTAGIFADSGAPGRPVVAQKQLVSGTNCQTAAQVAAKPEFMSKSAEYRDDVHITTRYCSATAHNQLNPTKPEIEVVSADPNASGETKIFFRTVPKNDANKVHDTCILAGKAAFAYLRASTTATPQGNGVVAGADVMTSSGKVDCEGFLRATDPANPLVVLAPGGISGSVISVHILNMIGLKKPATEVQAAVDNLGHQVAGSVGMSAEEIRKQPQIVLESAGAN
jgi:hypothetical protein